MLRFTTDITATLRAALSSYDYDRLFVVADTRTASVCVPLLGDALAKVLKAKAGVKRVRRA